MPTLMRMINAIYRCSILYRDDRMRGSELKPIQSSYLLTVCLSPGLTQEALARRLFIDKSQVTRQLADLERKGYVTRTPGEDRRQSLVYPTDRARAALPAVRRINADWRNYLFADLSPEEKELFRSYLARVYRRAQTYQKDASTIRPGAGPVLPGTEKRSIER